MSSLLWTFPLIMFASILIGWAAEVTAVHLSAGIALAILAWLQTLPEFTVEAAIAWTRNSELVLANFTGSLRLLLGLGWPMIFFVSWISQIRRYKKIKQWHIQLPPEFSVEAFGLIFPVFYFFVIFLKGSWNPIDGIILCLLYAFYFWLLKQQHKLISGSEPSEEENEDEPFVVRKILSLPKDRQVVLTIGILVFGGTALFVAVHPFIEGLRKAALTLGVSEYVFIQWIAPIASEFPEKITAFNWARKPSKVSFAIVNMISSVTSQWTLLAGLVPILYSLSAGHWFPIHLTGFQKTEILLTICQSLLVVLFLFDLKITAINAVGLFVLWLMQFLFPNSRQIIIPFYAGWAVLEAANLIRNRNNEVIKNILKVFK